jgi:hypothetical protein
MREGIVGIGIDLTQHVPLVSVAVCPEAIRADGSVDAAWLARHWPPKVELRGSFRPRLPTAVLPLLPGEPLLVGDAAAAHRRSAGLPWPPEAQVPYASEPMCGVGRIPLVAAWTALLPSPGEDDGLARRDDPEFKWLPDGREQTVRAGQILADSIKAFLRAASAPMNSPLTAIVVPDALDEAGQQILLDSLAQTGLSNVHLLPRPLAVALHWCNTTNALPVEQMMEDEEGVRVGRLRILTMALDVWEAVSLELRARHYEGRTWVVPIRDRIQLTEAPAELQTLGLGYALALAWAEAQGEPFAWWPRLFASDWLVERLTSDRELSLEELHAIREVCSHSPPEKLRQACSQLAALQPLWSRVFQTGPRLRDAIGQRWESQERNLGTAAFPCTEVLVDGVFAGLRLGSDSTIARVELPVAPGTPVQVFSPGRSAAVRGAALAAAAIVHSLPCYRETLLPLDLCVRGTDEYGDPMLRWKELVVARSVEAGRMWRSPTPVTGLQIEQGQDQLSLPLRRMLRGTPRFRRVNTELAIAATHDESVQVQVEVKPGQGFARVRIESVTPGVFTARLDWQTMEECPEPKPPPLAYLPGVSRILPDAQMFNDARPAFEAALLALWWDSPNARECLNKAIAHLNKWPLAHVMEQRRGHIVPKDSRDFLLHYGVIGSDGNLDALPEPGLVRDLRSAIGEKFAILLHRQNTLSPLSETLLRAGGWLYLAIPQECFAYLRARLAAVHPPLSEVELHAIGLAFESPEDLRRFYPLVDRALSKPSSGSREWLRAVRNICRYRNHALHPDAISNTDLYRLTEKLFGTLQQRSADRNHPRSTIFQNCLETIPFILKRRRYDPEFLAPSTRLAQQLIQFLERVDRESRWRLPRRLQPVPRAATNFLRMEASESDIEALLSVEDESDDDDG